MSISLSPLMKLISDSAGQVSAQLKCLGGQGSQISVVAMIQLQMTMNKFTQISDLGSTTVSLFNNAFRTMISNIKQ